MQIEFECLGELEDDLEWKVTYVGSAEDQTRDQILEEVMVGPVPMGLSKFVLTADAPDTRFIPMTDLVGGTVVFITCSYREKEFVRIGYYVNNEFYPAALPLNITPIAGVAVAAVAAVASNSSPADDLAGAPSALPQSLGDEELQRFLAGGGMIDVAKVYRSIMHEKPRVTRFQIDWTPLSMQQDEQQQDEMVVQQPQPQPPPQQHQQQMETMPSTMAMQPQEVIMQQQFHQQKALFSGGMPAPPLRVAALQPGPPVALQEQPTGF